MRCYLSNLLVQTAVLSLAVASAMAASPFPTGSNPLTRQALELRGGWTPDAKDVA